MKGVLFSATTASAGPIHSHSPTTSISATASRSRRYRARKRDGVVVAPVEFQPEVMEALVFCEFLDRADVHDRWRIAAAVQDLLAMLSDGELLMSET